MKFIDTHTHLYSSDFDNDRENIMQRASTQNVTLMLLPNIDEESVPLLKKTLKTYPKHTKAAMGLHPTSVADDFENVLQNLYQELISEDYVAIGEIGIDLYWDKSKQAEQTEAFKIQIDWAKKHHLPIIIHSRDSFDEIFTVMDKLWSPDLRGVFHCFSGTKAQADKIINDYGFKLGIGGVLTFKNSGLKQEIQHINLQHIVLETDAPYLAPVPYRGKRNESAYIPIVAQHLADLHHCNIEHIAATTTAAAQDLFGFNLNI